MRVGGRGSGGGGPGPGPAPSPGLCWEDAGGPVTHLLLTPWFLVGTGGLRESWARPPGPGSPGALCPLETPPAPWVLWAALGWARRAGPVQGSLHGVRGDSRECTRHWGCARGSWGLGLLRPFPLHHHPRLRVQVPSPGEGLPDWGRVSMGPAQGHPSSPPGSQLHPQLVSFLSAPTLAEVDLRGEEPGHRRGVGWQERVCF